MMSQLPSVVSCAASVLCAVASVYAGDNKKCEAIAAIVRAQVLVQPARVLIVVEDAIVQNELCACEVLKAAITAAKADPELVGQIVFTAITIAPSLATAIAECALAVAPAAAAEVEAALHRAVADAEPPRSDSTPRGQQQNGENGEKAKNPSQSKGTSPTRGDAIVRSPVEIGGIYLIAPGGGGAIGLPSQKAAKNAGRPKIARARVVIRPLDVSQGASDDPD
ncbi:MAG: hypothetical protein ACR2OZ_19715 [Verrucomicrobiales bacterium]